MSEETPEYVWEGKQSVDRQVFNALALLEVWRTRSLDDSEVVGVRGTSIENLEKYLRVGGAVPHFSGQKWQVQFSPFPSVVDPAEISTLNGKGAPKTPQEIINLFRPYAKEHAIIDYFYRNGFKLVYEFDDAGFWLFEEDPNDTRNAYTFVGEYIDNDGQVVRTDPAHGHLDIAREQGFTDKQFRELLIKVLQREGVQIGFHERVMYDFDLRLDDCNDSGILTEPNKVVPLEYIHAIKFHSDAEYQELRASLQQQQ